MKKFIALTAFILLALISAESIVGSTSASVPQDHSHASIEHINLIEETQKPSIAPDKKAAAVKKETSINIAPNNRIQPIIPALDQPTIKPKHKKIADNALRSLPKQYRAVLKTFRVLYDNPKNRGLAGKTIMILSGNVPDDEFRALFLHEMGHIIDLGFFTGSKESGPSNFTDGSEIIWQDDESIHFYSISWTDSATRKKTSKDEDFVSGYAQSDPFEDFAETMLAYLIQPEMLQKRAAKNTILQKKLQFMEQVVFNNFLPVAEGKQTWDGIPWDTTKLPYIWNSEFNSL